MRKRDPLSPEEHRELEALDRALNGEHVDGDLLELERLVGDVRETAPRMAPGFAARLQHQVEEGFPDAAEPTPARRRRRWVLVPATGAVAAALVALVVVIGGGGESGDGATSDSAPSIAREAPGEAAPAAPSAGATERQDLSAEPSPPAQRKSGPVSPSTSPRQVQRDVRLALSVPGEELESTADDVIATVDRFGGVVASSSIGREDGSVGEATFDLRVPTARLDDALAALSKLGHVAERRQELVDITASFTSTADRLSDARAERDGLREALGGAKSEARVDSLRARLRSATRRVSRLKGDLRALRRRADLATLSVTVRGDAENGDGSGAAGRWSPGDAAGDALRVLEVVAGVALIALAVAAPLALLAAAVAFGLRAGRRRRRESALDPA